MFAVLQKMVLEKKITFMKLVQPRFSSPRNLANKNKFYYKNHLFQIDYLD